MPRTDKVKRREYEKAWYYANQESRRLTRYKWNLKRYGLTPETYAEKFDNQNRCCAICGSDNPHSKRGWHIDHNHETGQVRDILCSHCNVMLGNAYDNIERLQAGIKYLERHSTNA